MVRHRRRLDPADLLWVIDLEELTRTLCRTAFAQVRKTERNVFCVSCSGPSRQGGDHLRMSFPSPPGYRSCCLSGGRCAGESVRSRRSLTTFPLGLAPIDWPPAFVNALGRILDGVGRSAPLDREHGLGVRFKRPANGLQVQPGVDGGGGRLGVVEYPPDHRQPVPARGCLRLQRGGGVRGWGRDGLGTGRRGGGARARRALMSTTRRTTAIAGSPTVELLT